MLRKDWLAHGVPLAFAAALVASVKVGFCDDAFITLRVAENVALGRGMVFNPGEHVYICTNPLWCLLMAGGRFVFGDTALATAVLGTLSIAALVLAVVRLGEDTRFGAGAGVFAAVLLVTNPVFILTAKSGVELPLYVTLMVVISWLLSRRRFTAATACAGLLVWVRFDGVVLLATTAGVALVSRRAELRARPGRVLSSLLPAAAIAFAYALFGLSVFHDVVPVSVRAKALTAPRLFSAEWAAGALDVMGEFAETVVGRSPHWYPAWTPALVVPVLFVLGVFALRARGDRTLVPLVLLSAVHVFAYVASGSAYATHFPWYFAPVLAATCLVGGAGAMSLLEWAATRSASLRRPIARALLPAGASALWIVASTHSVRADMDALRLKWKNRERVYAASAVWAGQHFGKGDVVAANEIGTIGYYLPPDVAVLDLFGLLRTKDTLKEPFVTLVERQRPACILTKQGFSYKKAIDDATAGSYRWSTFHSLAIGIRTDLAAPPRPGGDELASLYATVRLDREYPWPHTAARASRR